MILSKIITIQNEVSVNYIYKLFIDTDLSSPVPTDSKIHLRILDESDLDMTGALSSVILTNNNNKTASTYSSPNTELAIHLSKKEYDPKTVEYKLIPIIQDLRDVSVDVYQCNEIDTGNINIFLVNSFVSAQISAQTDFDSNTNYTIEFEFEKIIDVLKTTNIISGTTFQVYDGTVLLSDKKLFINFITDETESESTSLFSKYGNNVLYKFNNLSNLTNIEYMLEHGSDMNYQFNPVKIENGVTRIETDKDGKPVTIQIDIQKQIENLHLSQYLPEYKTFFNILDKETDSENLDLLKEVKKIFYTKTNLNNTSVKGVHDGIQNVLGIFCTVLGNYISIVEPDPGGHNFKYRVTSNLPPYYWYNIIKPIVHPLSWKDEYVYIDVNPNQPNTNIESHIHFKTKLIDLINTLNKRLLTYNDINHNPPFNTMPTFYELGAVGDFDLHYRFGFTPNQYQTQIDYNNPTLLSELQNINNLQFSVIEDAISGEMLLSATYIKTGYALEYYFEVYVNDVLVNSMSTNTNTFTIKMFELLDNDEIKIGVTLRNPYSSTETICSLEKSHIFSGIGI